MFYETAGDTGSPILLVMGLGMRGRIWEPQVTDLSKDHRVIYFDNRGIGESAAFAGQLTIRDFAADAMRVAEAAGWQRFHVVGVSLGGMIAQEMALAHPDRVMSLTLIATHAGGPLGMVPKIDGLIAFVKAMVGPAHQRVAALQQLLYTKEFLATIDQAALDRRMQAQTGKRAHPRTLVGQVLAVMRHDTRARLGELTMPTLIIRPGRDVLVRSTHSDDLAQRIPGSRMVRFDGAGHGVTFQEARGVSSAIRDHVAAASLSERASA